MTQNYVLLPKYTHAVSSITKQDKRDGWTGSKDTYIVAWGVCICKYPRLLLLKLDERIPVINNQRSLPPLNVVQTANSFRIIFYIIVVNEEELFQLLVNIKLSQSTTIDPCSSFRPVSVLNKLKQQDSDSQLSDEFTVQMINAQNAGDFLLSI